MKKQFSSTLLFIVFLIMGGVCHSLDQYMHRSLHFAVSTFLFCTVFLIYSGLILFWTKSVRRRLLPSEARKYMIAIAMLLMMFIVIRLIKYRVIPQTSVTLLRFSWYLYYVPVILVPTLFLMTSLYFGNNRKQNTKISKILFAAASMLTLGILTNDIHYFAFRPNVEMSIFIGRTGTYSYSFLFYAAYIWAGVMLVAGIILLVAASAKTDEWKTIIRPFLCIFSAPVMFFIMEETKKAGLPTPYLVPEILIFTIIGVCEICIRYRLLPQNEKYNMFFEKLDLPVCITDKEMSPVYQSAISIEANKEQMKQSVGTSVYPERDIRLSGVELYGGYAFFAEDESSLHQLNTELQEANRIIAMKNELLAQQQDLMEKKAAVEKRNALYDKVELEICSAQKRIFALLSQMKPNTPPFRSELAKVLVIASYVKRKANFVLLDTDSISSNELAAALKESFYFLKYCGINTDASVTADIIYPYQTAIAIYDFFEASVEMFCGKTEDMWLKLTDTEFLLMLDTEEPLKIPETSLSAVYTYEDGQSIIRIKFGGDEK